MLQFGFLSLLVRAGPLPVCFVCSGFIGATRSSGKKAVVESMQKILSPGLRIRMAALSKPV